MFTDFLDKDFTEAVPNFKDDTDTEFWFSPVSKSVFDVYHRNFETDELCNVGTFILENFDTQQLQMLPDDYLAYSQGKMYPCTTNDTYHAGTLYSAFYHWVNHRPEATVIAELFSETLNQEQRVRLYIAKLVGSAMLRALPKQKHFADLQSYGLRFYEAAMRYLNSGDFFQAPASTIYHQCYPGGLLEHSLDVASHILELAPVGKFSQVSIADAVQCALVHDWCKINLYEMYSRNVKNEQTGQWEKVPSYRRKEPALPLGHGVESMYKSMRLCNLNNYQALAIRWHMGEYNCSPSESSEMFAANENFPIVQMLQFADRLSCIKAPASP